MSTSSPSLKGLGLFAGLEGDLVPELEAHCQWKRFAAHQRIVSHLEGSDDVFFVVSGKARVIIYSASGKLIAFRDIGRGGIFGELAAIDGWPRSASVEGLEPGILAQLSAAVFRECLNREPTFANAVLRHLVRQVRSLTERIFEFSALAVKNRIHAELLRLAREGEPTCSGRIRNMPTHAELASRISTHREAVTRELNRLVQEGVIERQGTALVITDVARLMRMVEDASAE